MLETKNNLFFNLITKSYRQTDMHHKYHTSSSGSNRVYNFLSL